MTETETLAPKAETPIRKVEKIAEKVTAKVAESAEKTVETTTATMKDAQAKLSQGLHKAADVARGVVGVQRSALETVVKAGQIYGEGLQGMATHAADVSRTQFEDTMAHLRSLTTVKSVREAVELQAKFARSTVSRALTETSVFVEDYLKVAGQALAPVTTKAREAAEKVKSA